MEIAEKCVGGPGASVSAMEVEMSIGTGEAVGDGGRAMPRRKIEHTGIDFGERALAALKPTPCRSGTWNAETNEFLHDKCDECPGTGTKPGDDHFLGEYGFASEWQKRNETSDFLQQMADWKAEAAWKRRRARKKAGKPEVEFGEDLTEYEPWVLTQREATLVATVLQWLGTNVGSSYLSTALKVDGKVVRSVAEINGLRKEAQRAREQREEFNQRTKDLGRIAANLADGREHFKAVRARYKRMLFARRARERALVGKNERHIELPDDEQR